MPPTADQQKAYLEIWSKAVDTQMHFNEMSVKSRQFGLTFVAAALGLGITLLGKEDYSISIHAGPGFDINAAVPILLAGVFAMVAVRILDLNVYHKMLRGAVTFNEDFEEKYLKQLFSLEKGMTQAISHFSRHDDAAVENVAGQYHYVGNSRKNALDKIRRFYDFSIWSLAAAALGLFLITAHFGNPSHPAILTNGRNVNTAASPSLQAQSAPTTEKQATSPVEKTTPQSTTLPSVATH